jgi:hypothetical protein
VGSVPAFTLVFVFIAWLLASSGPEKENLERVECYFARTHTRTLASDVQNLFNVKASLHIRFDFQSLAPFWPLKKQFECQSLTRHGRVC